MLIWLSGLFVWWTSSLFWGNRTCYLILLKRKWYRCSHGGMHLSFLQVYYYVFRTAEQCNLESGTLKYLYHISLIALFARLVPYYLCVRLSRLTHVPHSLLVHHKQGQSPLRIPCLFPAWKLAWEGRGLILIIMRAIAWDGEVLVLPWPVTYQVTWLKGLAQAKIIKKSVILFWLLNMTMISNYWQPCQK